MYLCLSTLQCLSDQVISERAKGEFRGMTAKESTALCDRVVIFLQQICFNSKYETMSPMSSFKHIVCISNELPSMHTFPRTLCIMDSKAKDFHFFRFVFVLLYSLYCLVGNCPVAHLFLYFRTGCTNLLTCTPCTFIPLYPCTLHSTLGVRVG